MENVASLKKDIDDIKQRNKRVEADKAWETSIVRKIRIIIMTYILASLVMYMLGDVQFYVDSLIPTLGFFLSTLTLPLLKKRWIKKYLHKK